jgi:hypothetical protein
VLAACFGTFCAVYEAMIAGGKVVTLAHVTVVVIGCLFYWHLRLLELLADLGRPLLSCQLSMGIYIRVYSPVPARIGHT